MTQQNQDTELIIDTSTPTDSMTMIQQKDCLDIHQGTLCSRLGFSSVEQLTPEDFMKYIVPQIKEKQLNNDSLIVMKEPLDGHVTLIQGEGIFKYNLTGLEEFTIEEFREHVGQFSEFTLTPDIPWPLVYYQKTATAIIIVAEIPERKVMYTNNSWDQHFSVYLPPCWYGVSLSVAGVMQKAKIAAVPEHAAHWTNTQLKCMPLPNVFTDCGICFGSAKLVSPQIIEGIDPISMGYLNAVDLFFGAAASSETFQSVFGWPDNSIKARRTLFEKYPDAKSLDPNLDFRSSMIPEILRYPEGWRLLKLDDSVIGPMEFVGGLK